MRSHTDMSLRFEYTLTNAPFPSFGRDWSNSGNALVATQKMRALAGRFPSPVAESVNWCLEKCVRHSDWRGARTVLSSEAAGSREIFPQTAPVVTMLALAGGHRLARH